MKYSQTFFSFEIGRVTTRFVGPFILQMKFLLVRIFVLLILLRKYFIKNCTEETVNNSTYLLVAVGGVNVKAVIEDSDLVIRISRRESDLEIGGEKVGLRDVKCVNGCVLKNKTRSVGVKNGPHQENHKNASCQQAKHRRSYASALLLILVVVMLTFFLRHFGGFLVLWFERQRVNFLVIFQEKNRELLSSFFVTSGDTELLWS